MTKEHLVNAIVRIIERDFTDRRGLKQAWEAIDEEIRKEIAETWALRIKEALDDYTPQATSDERLDRLEKKVEKLKRRLKGGRPPIR